jgi:hypothetical protein
MGAFGGWIGARVRVLGSAVGFGVGALFVAAIAAYDAMSGRPPAAPALAAPMLAAGSVGGWLLGPLAWASQRRRDWVAAAVALALVAVGIGDLVVVGGVLLSNLSTVGANAGWQDPATVAFGVIELFVLGLLVVGWCALPFTLAASAIWAAIMCRLRGSVSSA